MKHVTQHALKKSALDKSSKLAWPSDRSCCFQRLLLSFVRN